MKLDTRLVCGIDTDSVRQHIARRLISKGNNFSVRVIAEGIETRRARFLRCARHHAHARILFAMPGFRSIP
ncbi:hypothetical protein [Burkholderia sp. THE68]|uniref:hypothetical protein n=1 Tax=Burkholderia sp. THE68 TaxID=758782 RepID=UPI001389D3CF|nr:hypothetical protein [Burkholderia sp. THE68]